MENLSVYGKRIPVTDKNRELLSQVGGFLDLGFETVQLQEFIDGLNEPETIDTFNNAIMNKDCDARDVAMICFKISDFVENVHKWRGENSIGKFYKSMAIALGIIVVTNLPRLLIESNTSDTLYEDAYNVPVMNVTNNKTVGATSIELK